jgi:large repetitive protein
MSAVTVPVLCALALLGGAVLADPAGADGLTPPTITSSDTSTFIATQAGSFTVTTTPGNDENGDGQVALSESGPLPDDVTFTDNGDGTATLAGTPLEGTEGSYPVTITASNGVEPDATQNFTLSVTDDPVAPTTVTVAGPTSTNAGASYAATASAPGAAPPPTYTLISGAPSWLSVDANSGNVSGSPPSGTKSFSYQVTATNRAGSASSAVQSVTVVVAPTSVSVSGPDSQVVGTMYQATATASGADVATTYTLVSGAPSWLSIDSASGAISGTIPEGNPQFYGYFVTATDSDGSVTSTEQFVTIGEGTTQVNLQATPGFIVGTGTQVTFTANVVETEGSGALTGTVSFTKNNAAVSGCTDLSPTNNKARCAITFPSKGDFLITANFGNDSFFAASTGSNTEQVENGITPVFTSSAGTTAAVGTPFSFTVSATGNPEPTLTETGALPSGVTFQAGAAGSATISGTAIAGTGGSYPLTLKATNGGGATTQAFTLVVDESAAITSASSATGSVGSALSFKVKTTGYPSATVTESGSLPSGVQFRAKGSKGTATIRGTPGAGTSGSYPITISASNGIGSPSTQDFVLTVDQGPTFTSAPSTTATVGTSFDFSVAVSASPEPDITETGALPSGVSFEPGPPGAASITGDPAAHTGGTYAIVLKAKASAGTVTQNFTLTVDEAPAITTKASATATVGTAFSFTVKATGFPAPTLSESGFLPPGLSFTVKHGKAKIAGTPGSTGIYDITMNASNGVGSDAVQQFVLTVSA